MCYLQCSSRIKPTTSLSVSLGSFSCPSWGESLGLDVGHLSKATSGPLAITCDQPFLAGVAHTGLPFLAKEGIKVINIIRFCILAIPQKKMVPDTDCKYFPAAGSNQGLPRAHVQL